MSDKAVYPVSDLFLFKTYNREGFEREFGRQAPPFNPDRRIKIWFDPDAPDGPYGYTYFNDQTKSFERMVISGEEAREVNLPGKYRYEPFIEAPTPAVVIGPEGGEQRLNPAFLCTREEAEEIARSLGAEGVVESDRNGSVFHIDWRGERRREYYIVLGGNRYNAGALLRARNAYGVGAPGMWYFTGHGPVWTPLPVPDGEGDPRPPVPVPCRELGPNERLHVTPFGAMVYRTDMDSALSREGSERDFKTEVLRRLDRIESLLERLSR